MDFDLKHIRQTQPEDGKVIVYWLGGSGFVFRFAEIILCVDPYLSNLCEKTIGESFRRLTPAPIRPDELHFDLLLISHDHPDHLDVDSFDEMIKANPNGHIFAGDSCRSYLENKKTFWEQLHPGDSYTAGKIVIEAVNANHGDLCPEAIGFVIRFSDRCIYYVGDSCYDESAMADAIQSKPQIIIPCINGAYGNLDERQAAVLAGKCRSEIAIPAHFGLFMDHGGCPRRFREYLKEYAPQAKALPLTPGRGLML